MLRRSNYAPGPGAIGRANYFCMLREAIAGWLQFMSTYAAWKLSEGVP